MNSPHHSTEPTGQRRVEACGVVRVFAASAALLFACTSEAQQVPSNPLPGSPSIIRVTGDHRVRYMLQDLEPDAIVDCAGAKFYLGLRDETQENNYILQVRSSVNTHVRKVDIIGDIPLTNSWNDQYENNNSAAFSFISSHGGTLEDARIVRSWDPLRAARDSDSTYIFRRIYVRDWRDDLIETDSGYPSVLIEDCLFDGGYSGYSCRQGAGSEAPDASDRWLRSRNVLMRLAPFPGNVLEYGTEPMHNSFMKLHRNCQSIEVTDNVWAFESTVSSAWRGNWTETFKEKLKISERNLLLWLGQGPFPESIWVPPGFTTLSGPAARDEWNRRRDEWLLRVRPSFGEPANSRLSNFSVRTAMSAGQTVITGFAVSGGSRQILVRGVGPTLVNFGLSQPMADPRLQLYSGGTLVGQNDNWDNAPALSAAFSGVGAFPLIASSSDAALLQIVEGTRTAHLTGSGTGVALVELYDTGVGNSPRLINVSARNRVGTGENILICGFIIDGLSTRNVLIRAVGPTLSKFGVTDLLMDPKLEVFTGGSPVLVASNDNWDASLASVSGEVGAFPLTANSRDAALFTALMPGLYTVHVSGVAGGTGEALVEVYEVP